MTFTFKIANQGSDDFKVELCSTLCFMLGAGQGDARSLPLAFRMSLRGKAQGHGNWQAGLWAVPAWSEACCTEWHQLKFFSLEQSLLQILLNLDSL